MGEIKFRAWEKEEKEMCVVNLLEFTDEGELFRVGCVYDNGNDSWRYKDMVELLQSTDLKDKNGKEIYRGDIIIYHGHGDDKHVVEYDKNTASFPCFLNYTPDGNNNIEVVGNIYENPDLLENDKDKEEKNTKSIDHKIRTMESVFKIYPL